MTTTEVSQHEIRTWDIEIRPTSDCRWKKDPPTVNEYVEPPLT